MTRTSLRVVTRSHELSEFPISMILLVSRFIRRSFLSHALYALAIGRGCSRFAGNTFRANSTAVHAPIRFFELHPRSGVRHTRARVFASSGEGSGDAYSTSRARAFRVSSARARIARLDTPRTFPFPDRVLYPKWCSRRSSCGRKTTSGSWSGRTRAWKRAGWSCRARRNPHPWTSTIASTRSSPGTPERKHEHRLSALVYSILPKLKNVIPLPQARRV